MLHRIPLLVVMLGTVLAAAVKPAAAADNTLSAEQKADGWQSLFDGKSIDGWSVKSGFATYKVEDGAIVGTTAVDSPNTFLVSDQTFRDFELTFDVRLDKQLNSGMQIRSKLRGEQYGGRVYGPQVEIGPGQAGFIYGEAAGGWHSPEVQSKDPAVNRHNHFKNGEWMQFRVRAVGPRIETWLNGHKITDFAQTEQQFENNPEGFLGLQVHNVGKSGPFTARWKNIFIRRLNEPR